MTQVASVSSYGISNTNIWNCHQGWGVATTVSATNLLFIEAFWGLEDHNVDQGREGRFVVEKNLKHRACFSYVWLRWSAWPPLELNKTEAVGYTCERFPSLDYLRWDDPKSGPHLLVAAHIKGHGKSKLSNFASLLSHSLASLSVLLLRHSFMALEPTSRF